MKNSTDENTKEIVKGEKDKKHVHEQLSTPEQLMPELRTLAYCTQKAVQDGFTENFKATNKGLQSMDTSKMYRPDQISVVDFYRFEGITDPADMSVLYVIRTDDGAKGTLVDAYGTYSDADVAKVIMEVESIAKKNVTR
ncbi:MAG TPA: hypothetical protein VGK59_12250 [Ohtaekwangia sp.]